VTEDNSEPTADAAQAFEDLRAEVSGMRRAVEALSGAWEDNQPPDYSPDLGRIAKGLAVVAGQLDAINTHPALTMTPEQHRQAIAQAGDWLVRETTHKLDRAAQHMERERQHLADLIGAARRRGDQRNGLITVGIGGLMLGVLVWTILVEVLPWGMGTWLAAVPIAGNKWDAGLELLREASPSSFEEMTTLYNTCGAQSVEFCQEAIAAKTVSAARQTETTPTKSRHKSELLQ
jgi:Family of unknown function (DUF6118)